MTAAKGRRVVGHVIFVAALIGLWQVLVSTGVLDPVIVGAPHVVLDRLGTIVSSTSTLGAIWVTIRQLALGLLIGGGLGTACGMLFVRVGALDRMFKSVFLSLYTIPRLAILPLIVVWFGFGDVSKIVIVAIEGFILMLLSAEAALSALDEHLVYSLRMFGASRIAIVRLVYLPFAAPYLVTGVRQVLGIGLGTVVVAELIDGTEGLGYQISIPLGTFDLSGVLAWVTVTAVIGLLINRLSLYAESRTDRWRLTVT